MKKNLFAAIAALAMALAIVVPVFAAATSNPFAVVNNGNMAIVDTAVETPVVEDLVETPVVEDLVETPVVEDLVETPVVEHVCTITKANEHRHIVDCGKCGVYEYVGHDEETLVADPMNQFFHIYTCRCGYAYSETHNYATTYTATSHREVCVNCGCAKPAEEHVWENDYYGKYHDVQCADCGFIEEHHVGVSFKTVDETNCQASCRQCGIVESVAHNFYDFECDNCHYEVRGYSYGIVEDIRESDDGYRVRFLVNGNSHRITLENAPDFNEGDFVEIDHYGNTIFGITVMVDAGVVDDPESFCDYILSDKIWEDEELSFDDIVIDEITADEEFIYIDFESGHRSMGLRGNYVVYDLMNGEMSELLEGYAYLTFSANDQMYFICIW